MVLKKHGQRISILWGTNFVSTGNGFCFIRSSNSIIFAFEVKEEDEQMTTMQLNAELFRSLSVIADDEDLMKRA